MNKFYNNNANIWDNVWKTDVYSKPDLRKEKAAIKVEKLLKHITIDNSTMVLDLGCGGGYIARELYNKTRAQIYGIDSSNEAIQLSVDKSKEIPIRYQKADITELPFSDDFADVILCIGVIEHVKEYECCLKEIKRVLKSNGLVYVVSSNRDSFIYEQKIVRERLGFWNYGYQKNWTKDELENVFSIEGFLTQYIYIDKGIGNFRFIDKMDKLFSTPTKKRGRYIYYIGRIYK